MLAPEEKFIQPLLVKPGLEWPVGASTVSERRPSHRSASVRSHEVLKSYLDSKVTP